MLSLFSWLSALLTTVQVGYASRFDYPGTGDPLSGSSLRCRMELTRVAYARALPFGVAHRTLPCGTALRIVNLRTGRAAHAVVLDRGPYGALLPNGRWVVKRRR